MILQTRLSEIILRPYTLEDAPSLSQIANNRNIWLGVKDSFPHPYTEENALDFFNMLENYKGHHVFAIIYKGKLAGSVGLHSQEDIYKHSVELGYFIAEPFWGKGIATVAVDRMLQYGFENLHLHRIFASVFERNVASMRVLEKCGFQKEGIKKDGVIKDGKIMNEHFYGLTKDIYYQSN
jgi:RimJ/RimL family protein N-acetyltransferase